MLHDLVKYYTLLILHKASDKALSNNMQSFFALRESADGMRGFGHFALPKFQTTRKSLLDVCMWD